MTTSGTSKSSGHWTMPKGLRRRWLVAPLDIFRSFREHGCYFLAASVSFYFLMSLVPMLFLFLAVIGYFLRDTATVRADLTNARNTLTRVFFQHPIDQVDERDG